MPEIQRHGHYWGFSLVDKLVRASCSLLLVIAKVKKALDWTDNGGTMLVECYEYCAWY